jgi:hypothetical protein
MEQDKAQPRQAAENGNGAPETEYNSRVRAMLSVIVIAGFALTAIFVILLQYLVGDRTGMEANLPTLETVGSIYAGVTGVVLGYWFGKGTR